jgi:branched-subunit amino acid ABC-type transport system permease component
MLNQLIANGVFSGFLIALLAVGFGILYSASRFFVFTFGAAYVWSAYTVLLLGERITIPLGIIVGMGIGSLLSIALEIVVYQPIRRRGDYALVVMLASIGAYIVLQNIVSMAFGDAARIVQTWPIHKGYLIFGDRLTGVQLVIMGTSTLALVLAWLFLYWYPIGKNLRAVTNDADLACVVGVKVDRVIQIAAGLGGGMAGLAGALTSLDTGVIPTMGFRGLLLGVVACILGGIGNLWGAVIGGFLLGILQQVAVWSLPTQWQDAIVFLVLIVVLIVRPQGLFGKRLSRITV